MCAFHLTSYVWFSSSVFLILTHGVGRVLIMYNCYSSTASNVTRKLHMDEGTKNASLGTSYENEINYDEVMNSKDAMNINGFLNN